jgi:hypothetical protein
MTELANELKAACESAKVKVDEIPDRNHVLQTIKGKFVNGDPRAWWTHMKFPPQIYVFENNTGYLHLEEIAPPSTTDVWFIADEDNELMHLYKIPLEKVKAVIGECRYFEYYVVAADFSWLIAENDHGNLLLTQAI